MNDLTAAVLACWEEYPQDRMSAVWSCLYASFKVILETGGDNIYGKHTGSRKAHHESREAGEIHDRSCPLQVRKYATSSLPHLMALSLEWKAKSILTPRTTVDGQQCR